MSNTTISPTVAALAATGVALAMGLAVAPAQAEVAANGLGATATAVSPVAPPFSGQPLTWSGLKANAAGAAGAAVGPVAFRQVRLTASGVFGSYGCALVQTSADNANWATLGAIPDGVSPGIAAGAAPGVTVTPIAAGIIISVTDPTANAFRYLRAVVQNGDGATAINVSGSLSTTGAV